MPFLCSTRLLLPNLRFEWYTCPEPHIYPLPCHRQMVFRQSKPSELINIHMGKMRSSFLVFDAVEEKPGSMLTKDAITNEHFSKIFSGIGQFPIEPVSIVLSADAEPVQKPAHRVPVALKDKFKQELKSMEKAGIISKLDCNTPTPWLNSYIIVRKANGSPKDLLRSNWSQQIYS